MSSISITANLISPTTGEINAIRGVLTGARNVFVAAGITDIEININIRSVS